MAGLSLRGGLGHLMCRFGLSCDDMVAAELVTADGRMIRASEDENQDLLWARGVASSLEARSPYGGYPNFAGTPQEVQAALEVTHGADTAPLRDLKRRYDPDGLFGR